MRKIIVIGSPGAGKTVFSRKLKDITNLPLYHLDILYHKKDGTHISKEELEEKLKSVFKEENWIIDGNYQRTLELRLKECDTVFLLDFSTNICIAGAESRIGKKRNDLPWVEEKLGEEFKKCIIDFSKDKLPQIYRLLDKYKGDKDIIIFKTREESDNYIKENPIKNENLLN
ncbi:MAG: adenylate kinase [Clostridia bacterium]